MSGPIAVSVGYAAIGGASVLVGAGWLGEADRHRRLIKRIDL